MDNNEHKLREFFKKLDNLIKVITVQDVSEDSTLDPNDFMSPEFQRPYNDLELRADVDTFLSLLQEIKFPGDVLQYSKVTETMFNNREFDGVENISERLLRITEKYHKQKLDSDTKLKQRFYKLIDHIQLASFQMGEISQHFREESQKLSTDISHSQAELAAMKDEIKVTNIQFENFSDELSKIYAQFVTILGIFTAIVISVFGGLGIVNGVFEKINETAVWKILLVGSMASLAVLSMLFLLTKWISSIVNITFEKRSKNTLINILKGNGAFATGVFIFSYLIIASVVFSSKDATIKLKSLVNVWDSMLIFCVLLIPILLGLMLLLRIIFSKKNISN